MATDQIRKLATDEFAVLYNAGRSRKQLAEHFNVPYRVVNNVVEYMGLRPVVPADLAPSIEEEIASRESLELAPSVARKARKFWEQHIERLRNESESATSTRIWKWHTQQQHSQSTVSLCRNRVLE